MVLEFRTVAHSEESVTNRAREVCVPIISDGFEDATPTKRSSAAEPIKSLADIHRISEYLVGQHRYRDNLLFVMGINYGLRVSDLLSLKAGHVLSADGTIKTEIKVLEGKTKKMRTIYSNDAVADALLMYFQKDTICLDDFLFASDSNRAKSLSQPMARYSAERILKEVINDRLGIEVHCSTHCLRKTFAYHVIMAAPDRSRAIEFLQKILGHSSQATTLAYAGITDEEIRGTYVGLNLASPTPLGDGTQELDETKVAKRLTS